MVTTLLVLNVIVALIRSGAPISLFGAGVPTLSLRDRSCCSSSGPAYGLRAGIATGCAPPSVADAVRQYLPEMCVAALFVIGLTVRLWGIGFGGPLVVHPDEQQGAGVAVTMLKSGWIKPPVPYHYPTVYHYVLLPAFGLKYASGKAAGIWTTLDDVELEVVRVLPARSCAQRSFRRAHDSADLHPCYENVARFPRAMGGRDGRDVRHLLVQPCQGKSQRCH